MIATDEELSQLPPSWPHDYDNYTKNLLVYYEARAKPILENGFEVKR